MRLCVIVYTRCVLQNTHIMDSLPVVLILASVRGEALEVMEEKHKEAQNMSEETKVVATEAVSEEVAANPMEAVMHDPDAPVITMKKLLEAGAHFGHQTRRWNPKMKKYIYGARNSVHIIDLAQTVTAIEVAYKALKEIVDNGGKVLFVGTKKQCQEAVEAEALRSGSFYITNRWLGGTLTNFKTIRTRIRFLKELERREEEGELDLLPKTEAAALRKEKEKLTKNLSGIKEMVKVPNAIFVIDPRIEHNAIAEARRLHIPVFGIIDTNCDPDMVDYVIPANDDAIRSVALILAVMADAVVESKGGVPVVAYVKDEGESVTMKDVINQTDKENREKLAKIRAERQARQEAYEREHAARQAARENGEGTKAPRTRKPAKKVVKTEEKVETPAEGENK